MSARSETPWLQRWHTSEKETAEHRTPRIERRTGQQSWRTPLCLSIALWLLAGASQAADREIVEANKAVAALLEQHGQFGNVEHYKSYVAGLLDKTSGDQWWRDKNGLFRLKTVDRWLREPLAGPLEAEALTWSLHRTAADPHYPAELLIQFSALLDLPGPRPEVPRPLPKGADKKLAGAPQILGEARRLVLEKAFQAFKPEDLDTLQAESLRLCIEALGNVEAHALTEEAPGKKLLESLARVDYSALRDAALLIVGQLNDRAVLTTLLKNPPGRYEGILIGGNGDDTYDLDALPDVACVIDPSGNDTYRGGCTSPRRPVLVVIDLAGNDHYLADKPFAQGCGHFGVSLLIDKAGDDRYEATDAAQGCGFVGVGVLIDEAGKDVYFGNRRVQGAGLFGIGVLIDRSGNDQYQGALFAQGHGGALGVGLIDDVQGDDHYAAGGRYEDSYQEPPHLYRHAWSQGCGSGLRGYSNGGMGIQLDGAGNDLYEADFFSTGGYWFAAGLSRDFGGNDIRRPLTQGFSRYGLGYGCHYAVGLLFDDAGDDQYSGGLGVEGFGWDISTGGLYDLRGNDRYEATGSGQGLANNTSWGILFDGGGSDVYAGLGDNRGQGSAGSTEYHPIPESGGNFSFLIDRGPGDDKFSSGAKPSTITDHSSQGNAAYVVDMR